jgi:hypothetical protein
MYRRTIQYNLQIQKLFFAHIFLSMEEKNIELIFDKITSIVSLTMMMKEKNLLSH